MRRNSRVARTVRAAAALLAVGTMVFTGPGAAGAMPDRPRATTQTSGAPYTLMLDGPEHLTVGEPAKFTYSLTDAAGQAPPRITVDVVIDGKLHKTYWTTATRTFFLSFNTAGPRKVALLASQRTDGVTTWIAGSRTLTLDVTEAPPPPTRMWGFAQVTTSPVEALPGPAGFDGSIGADGSVSGSVTTGYSYVELSASVRAMLRLTDATVTGQIGADGAFTGTVTARLHAGAGQLLPGSMFPLQGIDTCVGLPWTFAVGGTYHDGDLDLLVLNQLLFSPTTEGGCGTAAYVFNFGPIWGPISFLVRIEDPPSAFTPAA